MRWLIDGYNVIRRDPELQAREVESLEAGRAALLALLARVAARLSDDFTVVFDGARRSGAGPGTGRVQVVFSRPPESADDVLRRLAASLRSGGVVVSSDRAVQDAARRAGAVAVGAEAFVEAATEPASTSNDIDEGAPPRGRGGPSHRLPRHAKDTQRVLRRLRER
jgi:predicted RNA-binding protein with PIN domain